jgi:hypothetical protein
MHDKNVYHSPTRAMMYSMDAYFLEVLSDHIPGDGWTADARFSRKMDYAMHADVPKVTYPTHIQQATKASAESAAVRWARTFVSCSSDVLESSLRIREETLDRR